jgi:hypothetical protein
MYASLAFITNSEAPAGVAGVARVWRWLAFLGLGGLGVTVLSFYFFA